MVEDKTPLLGPPRKGLLRQEERNAVAHISSFVAHIPARFTYPKLTDHRPHLRGIF